MSNRIRTSSKPTRTGALTNFLLGFGKINIVDMEKKRTVFLKILFIAYNLKENGTKVPQHDRVWINREPPGAPAAPL